MCRYTADCYISHFFLAKFNYLYILVSYQSQLITVIINTFYPHSQLCFLHFCSFYLKPSYPSKVHFLFSMFQKSQQFWKVLWTDSLILSTLEYRLLKRILIIFYPCVVKLFITAVATVVADVGAEMIPQVCVDFPVLTIMVWVLKCS